MVCQFWPIHFWPIKFVLLCCGWFWCGLVFCRVFLTCVLLCAVCYCVLLWCGGVVGVFKTSPLETPLCRHPPSAGHPKNTTKIQRKRPNNCGGRRKENAKFGAPTLSGPPPCVGAPTLCRGPHPVSGPPPCVGAPTLCRPIQFWPIIFGHRGFGRPNMAKANLDQYFWCHGGMVDPKEPLNPSTLKTLPPSGSQWAFLLNTASCNVQPMFSKKAFFFFFLFFARKERGKSRHNPTTNKNVNPSRMPRLTDHLMHRRGRTIGAARETISAIMSHALCASACNYNGPWPKQVTTRTRPFLRTSSSAPNTINRALPPSPASSGFQSR